MVIITRSLEAGLRIAWLDPTDKPFGLAQEIGEEKRLLDELTRRGDWDRVAAACQTFVRHDDRMVDVCDFVVAYVDVRIHMCGTYDEISRARQQAKPVYLIIEGGKAKCPRWLLGKFDHREMFDTVDACIEHLARLDRGELALDERWVLFQRRPTGAANGVGDDRRVSHPGGRIMKSSSSV